MRIKLLSILIILSALLLLPLNTNASFCQNDPVNKTDPLGRDVYIVYREFALPGLQKYYWQASPAGIGHYYLAFDDQNVNKTEWSKLVNNIGKQTNPKRIPMPSHETFSFHPWSVRIDNQGKQDLRYDLAGIFYTLGTYVGYNDEVDIQSFLNAKNPGSATGPNVLKAKEFKVNGSQEQQFDLYRSAVKSRNKNNISARSSDFGRYMVLKNNCGSWAVHMIKSQNLTVPKGVRLRNTGGTGIGGIQDYLPFTHLFTFGAAGYGYTKFGTKAIYRGGKKGANMLYQGGRTAAKTTLDTGVMTVLTIDEIIKNSGGQYDARMLSDDTIGIGIRWDL